MEKHFKYILILIFFCFLPVFLVNSGAGIYLDFAEEKLINEFYLKQGKILKELKDKINFDAIRTEICEDIIDEIEKLKEITPAEIKEIKDRYDEKYPGLLRLIVFKNLSTEKEIQSQIDLKDREYYLKSKLKLIQIEKLPSKFIYKKFASYMIKYFQYLELDNIIGDAKEFRKLKQPKLKGSIEKLTERIIGTNYTPLYIATKPTNIFTVSIKKEKFSLYWNTTKQEIKKKYKNKIENVSINTSLVMIYINEEVYNRIFSLEKILKDSRIQLDDNDLKIEPVWFNTASDVEPFIKHDPLLKGKLRHTLESSLQLKGKDDLYVFMPVREHDRLLIYSKKKIEKCFPEKNNYYFYLKLASYIYIFIFIIVSIFVYYRFVKIFISVKTQIIALFLLASILPLSAIFYLGFQYIRTNEEILINDKFKEIYSKIMRVDENAVSFKGNLQSMANKLLTEDYTQNLDTAELEINLNKLNEDDLIDHYYVFDNDGKIILTNQTKKKSLESRILSVMTQIINNYLQTGSLSLKTKKSDDSKKDILTDMITSRLMKTDNLDVKGFNSTIIRQRGKIHKINLLSIQLILYAEPVIDKEGNPVASLCLVFEMKKQYLRLVENFIEVNQTKKNRDFDFIPWRISEKGGMNRKYKDKFNNELHEIVKKIKRDNKQQNELIDINGKRMIVTGARLKEMPDYILLGMYPYEKIETIFYNNVKLFILLFVLTILIAVFVAVIISRKFIYPVIALENGVKAISSEDYSFRMNIESFDEFGNLSNTFNEMITGLQEKIRMSRYVSQFVLDEVKKDDDELKELGEEKKVTILFSDIRNFTTLSETYLPSEIVRMLNEYLEIMTSIIQRNGGVIDKFIGDAIMAVFHSNDNDDEINAVIASLQMRETLKQLNAKRRSLGQFEIDNGIGINTGKVIQGNIGSKDYRIDLTVIGDNVNLAARLEAVSKEGKYSKIILSEDSYDAVRNFVEVEKMGERTVKGKTKSVALYEITRTKNIEKFLAMIQDDKIEMKIKGLSLIALTRNVEAIPYLINHLNDNEETVRETVVFVLRNFFENGDSIIPSLESQLEIESNEKILAEIQKTIEMIRN